MPVIRSLIVPGLPHPLLVPDRNPGWARLRTGFDTLAERIRNTDADLLVLYSTQWASVIGHQIQADPEPEWVHVDPEFHELGTMPYRFRIDTEFAETWCSQAGRRGLHARTVAYRGFPIDTGTIVALSLLNPGNRLPAAVVSCNMYADRAETLVLGKATADAVAELGRRAVAVAVTALSARLHTEAVDAVEDHVSSELDDEWNRKVLEFLAEGRLEDVSQLVRTFTATAHADNKGKALWWLAAASGQHNDYSGAVHAYEPLWGTGAAVVELVPSHESAANQEYDEDDVEKYLGERAVLEGASNRPASTDSSSGASGASGEVPGPTEEAEVVAESAPTPVGAYPHARRVGDLLYLSGMGPRQPGTDAIPGGPVRDASGKPLEYDVAAQTEAAVANVRAVLEASGAALEDVVDVTVFLVNMDRDFSAFNAVYARHFGSIRPTRTTVEVRALPTPIAVELKVVARVHR